METLKELIKQQQQDLRQYKIKQRIENQTLIRPHVFRFYDFAGNSAKQQAFSVLCYFGWTPPDIISVLNLTALELSEMVDILETTHNEYNYDRFFKKIPADNLRDKAILILRGLKWKQKDISQALGISRRTVVSFSRMITNPNPNMVRKPHATFKTNKV